MKRSIWPSVSERSVVTSAVIASWPQPRRLERGAELGDPQLGERELGLQVEPAGSRAPDRDRRRLSAGCASPASAGRVTRSSSGADRRQLGAPARGASASTGSSVSALLDQAVDDLAGVRLVEHLRRAR